MTRVLGSILLLACAALASALAPQNAPTRFAYVDIVLDAGEAPLAAWQVELDAGPGVTIVGIEGGEHAAFSEPPYYDPKAMMHDRVILGAFDTGDDLPTGPTRVARVHVQIEGDNPAYELSVTTAATVDGTRIDVDATVIEGSAE